MTCQQTSIVAIHRHFQQHVPVCPVVVHVTVGEYQWFV
jgi:hypothetical protein